MSFPETSLYPGAIDTDLAPAGKTNSTPQADDHPAHHNRLADAIEKLETVIGINPAGGSASVAARIAALEARPKITYGTTPPVGPLDGDEWVFPADATNGVMWRFRYNSASASAYKWEFVGGSEVAVFVMGNFTSATLSSVDGGGPQFTIPRSGDYRSQIECVSVANGGTNWRNMGIELARNGVVATNGADSYSNTHPAVAYVTLLATSVDTHTANDVIKIFYRVVSAAVAGEGVTWYARRLYVRPVRVA